MTFGSGFFLATVAFAAPQIIKAGGIGAAFLLLIVAGLFVTLNEVLHRVRT
jgi:hypothetical protein